MTFLLALAAWLICAGIVVRAVIRAPKGYQRRERFYYGEEPEDR